MLKIFFLYRIILSSTFLYLVFYPLDASVLNYLNPTLFKITAKVYFCITLFAGFAIFTRIIAYTPQAQLLIFTDIIAITLVMHAWGGIASGVGILLLITITFGGILIGGHCALLFAALASLTTLAEQAYAIHTHAFNTNRYTEAGLLGAAFFTTAFLAYILAQRSEQSQLIAQQHKKTILKLEELNQSIIQHLEAGIIIVDRNQHIEMYNESALRLLKINAAPSQLLQISAPLSDAFQSWLKNTKDTFTFNPSLTDQSQIHCRFSLLPTQQEILHMIMLEDVALYNQRLQQSKLASLGRLTASIAHEIRNPLGAISHAAQLLEECPSLTEQNTRLTEIIQTHSKRINNIIEEILHLSRRKTSQRQKIALNLWLIEYTQNFILYQHLKPEQLKLVQTDNLNVLIDTDHLQQIMDNLCQNALKHSRLTEPHITLTTEQNQQGIFINISDDGPLISPENIEQLFEPFFTTSATGTGLGLYISKELAELNQAKLSYHLVSYATETAPYPKQTASINPILTKQFNNFRLCLRDADQPKLDI